MGAIGAGFDITPLFIPLLEIRAMLEVTLGAQAQVVGKLEDRDSEEILENMEKEVHNRIERLLELYQDICPELFTPFVIEAISRSRQELTFQHSKR
jgi:hypothetical protein